MYNGLMPEAFGLRGAHFVERTPTILEIEDLPGVRLHKWSLKAILDRMFWTMVLKRTSAFLFVNSKLMEILPVNNRPALLLPGLVERQLTNLASSRRPPFAGPQFVLMYAGGLTIERGFGVLLEAVPLLPPNWQLVVSGGGPLIGALKDLSLKYPEKCRYLGFLSVEELYQQMTKADAVINTPEKLSDQSGVFPFKICEYLVSGAHVISSKLPNLEGCDIGMIQRWSGKADDLPAILLRSAVDFQNETLRRQAIADWVVRCFGMEAVSRSLNELIARCRRVA
jgi:glycosyltransferase involved in cell wall biosynthesis